MENPFLYACWQRLRRRPWVLLLLFVGPLLAATPLTMREILPVKFSDDSALLAGLQLFVTYLCVRAVGATVGAFSQERERSSWDVLLTSGMGAGRIAAGMWLAALAPCLAEVLVAAAAALLFWGSAVALPLAALWLVLVLFFANWSLFCSLRFPSFQAAQFAYGWLGACAGTGFFAWVCHEMNVSVPGQAALDVVNPWTLTSRALRQPDAVLPGILTYAALAAIVLGLLAFRVGSSPARNPARPTRTRRNSEDPLAYRHNPRRPVVLVLYVLVMAGSTLAWEHDRDATVFLTLAAHVGFWLVRTLHTTTAMLCREKEGRTLDALLTTRLSPAELCSGLWGQSVRPVLWEALLLSPLLFLLIGARPCAWLYLTVVTLVSIGGWGAIALAVSMRSRTTLGAFQVAYLGLAAFLMGTLIIDVCVLTEVLPYNGPLLALANPLVACLAVVENRQDWQYFAGPACLLLHGWAWYAGLRFVQRRLGLR